MTASVTRLTRGLDNLLLYIAKTVIYPLVRKILLAHASLAQLVERALRKRKVLRSNRKWGRIFLSWFSVPKSF